MVTTGHAYDETIRAQNEGTKCRIANGWKLGSENKPASWAYRLLPYT